MTYGGAEALSIFIVSIATLPVDQYCCWLIGFCQEQSVYNLPRTLNVLS